LLLLEKCYSGDHTKKNRVCWYVAWVGWGHIQVLVGKLEGKNHLKILDIDGRIILNVSERWFEFGLG
jgi:hypothetical protein